MWQLVHRTTVVVSVFEAAMTPELAQREDDQKVITFNVKMCTMMQIMTL